MQEAIESEIENSEYLSFLENKYGLNRNYIIYIGAGAIASFVIFGFGADVLCNIIGIVFPTLFSFRALSMPEEDEEADKAVDAWLKYWVVYGVFELTESVIDQVLWRIPFYYLIKVLFIYWCTHPRFRGAELLYNSFLQHYLRERRIWLEQLMFEVSTILRDFVISSGFQTRLGFASVFIKTKPMSQFVPSQFVVHLSDEDNSIENEVSSE